MQTFFNENKIFFLLFFCWFVVLGLLILLFGSHELFIRLHINLYHQSDVFFRIITELGSFSFSVLIALFLLWKNRVKGLCAVTAMILSSVGTHLLKIFVDAPRPWLYFKNAFVVRNIEGVVLLPDHSFPSGHSTAAFALATVLSFIVNEKRWSVLFFFLAVGVGYSRIYLGQHFPLDVYAGSLIGVLISSITWISVVKSKQIELS